jgi:hypothetical protein
VDSEIKCSTFYICISFLKYIWPDSKIFWARSQKLREMAGIEDWEHLGSNYFLASAGGLKPKARIKATICSRITFLTEKYAGRYEIFQFPNPPIIDWRFLFGIFFVWGGGIGRGLLILCSENIRVLKNQFESEANSIRHEMDALRELHHVSLESPTGPASPSLLLPPPLVPAVQPRSTCQVPHYFAQQSSQAKFV